MIRQQFVLALFVAFLATDDFWTPPVKNTFLHYDIFDHPLPRIQSTPTLAFSNLLAPNKKPMDDKSDIIARDPIAQAKRESSSKSSFSKVGQKKSTVKLTKKLIHHEDDADLLRHAMEQANQESLAMVVSFSMDDAKAWLNTMKQKYLEGIEKMNVNIKFLRHAMKSWEKWDSKRRTSCRSRVVESTDTFRKFVEDLKNLSNPSLADQILKYRESLPAEVIKQDPLFRKEEEVLQFQERFLQLHDILMEVILPFEDMSGITEDMRMIGLKALKQLISKYDAASEILKPRKKVLETIVRDWDGVTENKRGAFLRILVNTPDCTALIEDITKFMDDVGKHLDALGRYCERVKREGKRDEEVEATFTKFDESQDCCLKLGKDVSELSVKFEEQRTV